ncbi:hypothetical protein GO988_01200 [Hymenobacter sp. HMF4947]|uniref:Uncharacterized protein n=1 Tax=Hymenobacter ginkgonis TaxID=2682976 RepID=A0A7K1T948_9BACT|nr:hypothetical protein [Hymenobacter ginkgonis]MVN74934.1 hypothetical protein [Hymenobacter ginkgonis]
MQWSQIIIRKWQQAISWLQEGEPTPPYPLTPDEWAHMLAQEQEEELAQQYEQPMPMPMPMPKQRGLALPQKNWAISPQLS